MNLPIADKKTHKIVIHGEVINDDYFWLRDKNWPKVETPEIINYLNEENLYYKNFEDKDLEQTIYNELKGRIKEKDESYPIKKGNFYYYTRIEQDYPIVCRKRNESKEEILIDFNVIAEGKSSFSVGDVQVSENHNMLAYAYDNDGSERYIIEVENLVTKQKLNEEITNTIGEIVWNNDSTGFYYILLDENWRSKKVFFHKLNTKQQDDILIYEEKDEVFSVQISASSSHDYLFIVTGSSTSNEVFYLSLNDDAHKLDLIINRRDNHLYEVDYLDNKFYLLTNDLGKNFRLVYIDEGKGFETDNFVEIIAHSEDYYLVDFAVYRKGIIVTKNILGINNFEYYSIKGHHLIDKIFMEESLYQASAYFTNADDDFFRIHYSSLTTPKSVLEYNPKTKELFVRKTEEIPSGYDPSLYQAERIWVETEDNVKVPVSLVYKKELKRKRMPLVLYGYGSYGLAMPVNFRSNIISLLDRGICYAIAHIRGGDELGFQWYESAKFLNKKLTFSDFIAVSEYLVTNNYTTKDQLCIMGGSAGGMLMGVVVNERPELFKSVVALVPFVDVLNTMLDDSLPLTPGEFEEWGNPIKNKEYFDYIRSYSPYDNIKKQDYPQMLVTAGLTDPRVGYWEAAKWVAKLRALKLDNNIILLKTEMDSGHKGQSGRFKSLEETSMIYSFIIRSIM